MNETGKSMHVMVCWHACVGEVNFVFSLFEASLCACFPYVSSLRT